MSKPDPALLRDLETLVATFRSEGWAEMRLEVDGVELLLSHDAATPGLDGEASRAPAARIASPAAAAPPPAAAEPVAEASGAQAQDTVPAGWVAVAAPNLGTFYRSPKPGAPVFVDLGQAVAADTEICLLEVMKLFTSVKAGVAGVVRRICAADAELVEGGRVLFYIEPLGS